MTPDDFHRIATDIAERKAYTSEFASAIELAMQQAYELGVDVGWSECDAHWNKREY